MTAIVRLTEGMKRTEGLFILGGIRPLLRKGQKVSALDLERVAHAINALVEQQRQQHALPLWVRIALTVVLNHVEPSWENSTAAVRRWLEGQRKAWVKPTLNYKPTDTAGQPICPEEFARRREAVQVAAHEIIWLATLRGCLMRWVNRFTANPLVVGNVKETQHFIHQIEGRITQINMDEAIGQTKEEA